MEPLMLGLLLVVVFFVNIYASIGGGGSLLIYPTLLFVGMPANVTVGTNRIMRLFSSGIAAAKYVREVRIDTKNLIFYSALTVVGAVSGALIVLELSEQLLKAIISVSVILIALFFFVKKDLGVKKQTQHADTHIVFSSIALFGLGVYRSIISSAAGLFLRTYFVAKEGMSFLQATTYASILSFVASIFATIVFVAAGNIDYTIAAYMVVVGTAGSYIGAHLAIRKGNAFVKNVFMAVAILVSLKIILEIGLGV